MGQACATGAKESKSDRQFQEVKQRMSQSQLRSLCLIYNDLAERDPSNRLNIQNFQLFFHKNGFWGARLFREFDTDESGNICEKQFIKGIVRIFKTSEEEKIKLLYHFFEKEGRSGITFDDFVVVLYNYPKVDLKEIFNDDEFVDTEIKKKLVEIRRGNNLDPKRNESGDLTQYRIEGSDNESDAPIPSAYGFKGIIQDLKKKRSEQEDKMSLNFNINGKAVEVKTSNIQHLVKRFARKLFKEYNINEKTGRLKYEDFRKWISNHKNLYKNYYDGFHNQVWEDSAEPPYKPKYMTSKSEKESTGKMEIHSEFRTVHLYFLNSTVIISAEQSREEPIFIICLDGLAVKKIFDQNRGFGIEISHRDGLYNIKSIYLRNQESATEWMSLLKFFKGTSVQQQYSMGEKIGTGKFSIVYACREKKTSREYAMKVIESTKLDAQARQLIAHESSIMNVLNYPLLVYFKESIQTKTHLYIVTELVKGKDLFEFVKENGPLKEIEAAKVIRQLILGVKHLHDMGIVHRDLKPENIMIVTDKNRKESESVKIIDFGFSNYKTALKSLDSSQMLAGTPSYIAPEILNNDEITEKIDNFAIGAIIYFVLSGTVPFNGHNIQEMFQKTINGAYSFDHKPWRTVGLEAKDLIDKLLLSEAEERISLEQALKHQWFIKTCVKNTSK